MKTIEKVCLRCDWEGETRGPDCPSCGTRLWVPRRAGEPRGRRWRGPSLRRQRRPRGPRAQAEAFAPEVEPAPAPSLPSHPDAIREPEPEVVSAPGSRRDRRRAVIAVLVVAAVAVAAAIAVREGTPVPVDPVARGIGGRLLYAITDDADPSFHRIWIWDMTAGTYTRGPRLPEPIQLFSAANIGPDGVTSISLRGDGVSADLLRFLGPTDQAVSVLEGDRVAWAPRGAFALAASVLPRCEAIEVRRWSPLTGRERNDRLPCSDLVGVAATDLATYVAVTDGGPPVIHRVTDFGMGELARGFLPVGGSGSDLLMVAAGGPNDADVGPTLYVSSGSPGPPGPLPFGVGGERFAFEALLAPSTGLLGDLVLGSYAGVRGIYRIDSYPRAAAPPALVMGTAAGTVGATSTRDGVVIANLDGRLVAIRNGVVSELTLPENAPATGSVLLWLPSPSSDAAEATP